MHDLPDDVRMALLIGGATFIIVFALSVIVIIAPEWLGLPLFIGTIVGAIVGALVWANEQ